jgi:hypothetical protein
LSIIAAIKVSKIPACIRIHKACTIRTDLVKDPSRTEMIVYDVVYLNQECKLCCNILHVRPAGIGGENSKNLSGEFEKMRVELGITREEFAWLLTDGASNMMGEFGGLGAEIMNHWFEID